MKKNLIAMTAVIIVAVIAATLFAEDAAKPRPSRGRPERPSVKTSRSQSARPQRTRGLEGMMQRTEAEIKRLTKVHDAETKELKAILKQANKEKATKTAAMLSDLIKKIDTRNAEKIKQIKTRAEDFKKRMQRTPRSKDAPAGRPYGSRPTRNVRPARTRGAETPKKK